jgi:hypothetical protein
LDTRFYDVLLPFADQVVGQGDIEAVFDQARTAVIRPRPRSLPLFVAMDTEEGGFEAGIAGDINRERAFRSCFGAGFILSRTGGKVGAMTGTSDEAMAMGIEGDPVDEVECVLDHVLDSFRRLSLRSEPIP